MFHSSSRNGQPGPNVQSSYNPFARTSKPTNPFATKHPQGTETPKPNEIQTMPIVQPRKPEIIEVLVDSVSTDSIGKEGIDSSMHSASRNEQPTRIGQWDHESDSNPIDTPHLYSPEKNSSEKKYRVVGQKTLESKTDETLYPIAKRTLKKPSKKASDDLHIDDRRVYHSTQNNTDGRYTHINFGPTHSVVNISQHERYTISKHIESGAQGSVDRGKRVVQTRYGIETTDVALKQMYINPYRDPNGQNETALREYEILKYLDHIEGVIRCFDAFPVEKQVQWMSEVYLNLALELGGPALSAVLSTRQPGDQTMLQNERIASSLLKTVSEIYDAGILHCDIKPKNILIQADGTIKLCDFGNALFKNEDGIAPLPKVFTPSYAPPEFTLRTDIASQKSEIYQIGLTLFELYVGVPFCQALRERRASQPETTHPLAQELNRHRLLVEGKDDPRSVEFGMLEDTPNIPFHIKNLIKAMLQFMPENRPTLEDAIRMFNEPDWQPNLPNVPPTEHTAEHNAQISKTKEGESPKLVEDVKKQVKIRTEELTQRTQEGSKIRRLKALLKSKPKVIQYGRKSDVVTGPGAMDTSAANQRRSLIQYRNGASITLDETAIGKGSYGKVKPAIKRDKNGIETKVGIKRFKTKNPAQDATKVFGEFELHRKCYDRARDKLGDSPPIIGIHNIGIYEAHKAIYQQSTEGFKIPDKDDATHYHITIEFELATGSLAIPEEGLDLKSTISKLAKLVQGIDIMHELGIVHADIKKDNILVDSEGEYKLGDFGLATGNIPEGTLVEIDSIKGTPYFWAPEMWSRNISHESDWYSLGCLFSQMITGKAHYVINDYKITDGDKVKANYRKLKEDQFSGVFRQKMEEHLTEKGAPRKFIDLVLKMTEIQPSERPHSGEEILTALAEIEREL